MPRLMSHFSRSVFSICSLASIHASYAGPNEESFNADMDKWQRAYPVLEQCGPLYIVHSIFHDGERMIDESSEKKFCISTGEGKCWH